MTSTLACASSSAARRISLWSNCAFEDSDSAISVTLKREKCAETPSAPDSIAQVTGSSAVFDEGVSMPSRFMRHLEPAPRSHRQPAAIVDQGRTDQQSHTGERKIHHRQEVGAGRLHDKADDQRGRDARDIAAE